MDPGTYDVELVHALQRALIASGGQVFCPHIRLSDPDFQQEEDFWAQYSSLPGVPSHVDPPAYDASESIDAVAQLEAIMLPAEANHLLQELKGQLHTLYGAVFGSTA